MNEIADGGKYMNNSGAPICGVAVLKEEI